MKIQFAIGVLGYIYFFPPLICSYYYYCCCYYYHYFERYVQWILCHHNHIVYRLPNCYAFFHVGFDPVICVLNVYGCYMCIRCFFFVKFDGLKAVHRIYWSRKIFKI